MPAPGGGCSADDGKNPHDEHQLQFSEKPRDEAPAAQHMSPCPLGFPSTSAPVRRPRSRHSDRILEPQKVLLADASNVHEVFNLLEGPILHRTDDERGGLAPIPGSASISLADAVLMLTVAAAAGSAGAGAFGC